MGRYIIICIVSLLLFTSSMSQANTVNVAFLSDSGFTAVQRAVAEGEIALNAALQALVSGPTEEEQAAGISSAIPPGTRMLDTVVTDDGICISLSEEAIINIDDYRSDTIFRQFLYTLEQFNLDSNVKVLYSGKPLSDYLQPAPIATYAAPISQFQTYTAPIPATAAAGLAGKRITLSPGHGYYYTGSTWTTQRGTVCGFPPEDFHNVDIARWLKKYLEQDGAYVQPVREFDTERAGTGPSGNPWWKEASYVYLNNAGYSCSVTASSSGVCNVAGGVSHSNDDIRARPLASNLDSRGNTDIFLSVHTNAYNGTLSGTEVYYCNTGEHVNYGTVSYNLAKCIIDEVTPAIRAAGETRADGLEWVNRGGYNLPRYGDLGEIRLPLRPAALIELGFHDNCTADASKMEDPFFQSVSMWGMYKGICNYFGTTPTWGMYSNELVSHTIPATMAPGETKTATITFKNRGVLWIQDKNFKLGAVGNSDPFTTTIKQNVTSSTETGDTYTFTLTLKAPETVGIYVTDWQMLREGYEWFGDICSVGINVGGEPDTQAPTVPTNLSGSAASPYQINLNWNESTDNHAVAGYRIYRDNVRIGSSYTNSYSDKTCAPSITYSYKVSAYDASGNESAQSQAVSITTPYATEYILDEDQASLIGSWASGGTASNCYNNDYIYSLTASSETAAAMWIPNIQYAANYKVYIQYRDGANRTLKAPYTIYYNGGSQTYTIDQRSNGGTWILLGTKPFQAGTSGYVKLSNYTGEAAGTYAVIADAVRFVYDSELSNPPAAPTDGTPSVLSSTSIRWAWSDVSDETGYRVKDIFGNSKSGNLAANTTSWTETNLLPNTQYLRKIYAFNTIGESSGSSGQRRYTLARAGISMDGMATTGNVYCSSADINTWYNSGKSFTFTNPAGFGSTGNWKAAEFEYKWNTSATESWNTAGTSWTSGSITLTAASTGNYYLHVRAINGDGVANNAEIVDYGPFKIDANAPSTVTVTDEGTYTPSTTSLSAVWTASADAESGISGYEYAIGTSASTQDIRDWTSLGNTTQVNAAGLSLSEGQKYYIQVRAADMAGNTSVSSSDGITVAVSAAKISDAWAKSNTQPFALRDKIVTHSITGAFWLEETDRSSAIKVLSPKTVSRGNTVSVAGNLIYEPPQRVMLADVVKTQATNVSIAPLGMALKSIGGGAVNELTPGITGGSGLYNLGILARCWGRVDYSNTDNPADKYFYLDDGSGITRDGHKGVLVKCGNINPPTSGIVILTGIIASQTSGDNTVPVIIIRDENDLLAM